MFLLLANVFHISAVVKKVIECHSNTPYSLPHRGTLVQKIIIW